MSQPATEAPPAPKKPAAKGTGLTKKVGPLPVWGWAAAAATAAVVFIWEARRAPFHKEVEWGELTVGERQRFCL